MPPLAGQFITPEEITGPIDDLDERVTVLEGITSNALGIAYALSNQSNVEDADLDGLEVGVSVPTTQLLKITVHVLVSKEVDTGFMGSVFEGASRLGRFAWDSSTDSGDNIYEGSVVIEVTAGSHTFTAHGERTTPTGTFDVVNATEAGYILVQAIGRT